MSYLVVFKCPNALVETKARAFRLEEGLYAYVGSCGVSCHKRILRHLRRPSRRHWHVDFLPCEALLVFVTRLGEAELAARLAARVGYIAGFGSSDDKSAPSHLFKTPSLLHLLDVISAGLHDQLGEAHFG